MQEQDGKEMVRVPAGPFLYGDGKERTKLPEFWIDRTPVTNAEYAQFVAAMEWREPKHWEGCGPPEAIADHPVTEVSWEDATAYAEWAGKRLPTEQEWEKAARGTDGREYPWGNGEPTRELCNFDSNEGGTTPVGKYSPQGDSSYGGMDMAGNVWEWTASTAHMGLRVVRGGSWGHAARNVRCAFGDKRTPVGTYFNVGFRCARSAE